MTTIRIKLPTIEQVEFTLEAKVDDTPVRGNAMASGDDKHDRNVENGIIRALNNGNVWAWASVGVTAKYRGIESDTEYLGCCSYKNEKDFVKNSGHYDDMKQDAYANLIIKIKALAR